MALYSGTVKLTGIISPYDDTDTYAVFDDIHGRGGYKVVSATTERDDIVSDRRKHGMMVYVTGNSTTYILTGDTNSDWEIYSGGNHTHPASEISSGTFGAGSFTFQNNVYADNLQLTNRLYLNGNGDYDEAVIHFDSGDKKFFLYNTGATEFRVSHDSWFSGDVLSNRHISTYDNTGTTATGTTILSGGAWDFYPAEIVTEDYSWNFIESGLDFRSGILDHTIFWDERTNEYHIIGIRTVSSAASYSENYAHVDLHAATFLHAKTKTFSADTFEEVGIIDSLGGLRTEDKYFDGHIISNVWAPHLIEYDNAYYMFYTGVEFKASDNYRNGPDAKQRNYCAKSHSLTDWSAPEIKFLFDGTAEWSRYAEVASWSYGCRDPYVIFDEVEQRWTTLVSLEVDAAYSDSASNTPAIGMATATTLMGEWNLIDWYRVTEGGDAESPQMFLGEDNNWYLAWTYGPGGGNGFITKFASAATLADTTGFVEIPAMSGMSPATEIIPSPYVDNYWLTTTIDPYVYWSKMVCSNALTFTGGTPDISYTEHTAMTIGYSSTTLESRINLTDTLIGHIGEHNIHYDLVEMDGRFSSSAHTQPASTITSGTFPSTSPYIWNANLYMNYAVLNNDLYINDDDNPEAQILFGSGPAAWIAYNTGHGSVRIGPDTKDTIVYGNLHTGKNLYLGNPVSLGSPSGNDDNIIGSGIWFGSGNTSENITYQTDGISASTSLIVNGIIYSGGVDISTMMGKSTAWFNVMVYGAIADGIIDDITAIQDTIDACAAAGGGYVYLPAGSYYITKELIVNYDYVTIIGDGQATKIITPSTTGRFWIQLSGFTTGVKDLTMVGKVSDTDTTISEAIEISEICDGCVIDNVFFTGDTATNGFTVGIRGRSGATNVHINKCRLNNIRGLASNFGYGIQLAGVSGGTITNNMSRSNAGQGRHHIYISAGCQDLNVDGNVMYGGESTQISMYCTSSQTVQQNIKITNNILIDGNWYGISATDNIVNCDVSDNILYNNAEYAFLIQQISETPTWNNYNKYSNNIVYNCKNEAFWIQGAENIEVVNNKIYNPCWGTPSTQAAILLHEAGRDTGCDNITIHGNTIRGTNHRYAVGLNGNNVEVYGNTFDSGSTSTFSNHDPDRQKLWGNNVTDGPTFMTGTLDPETNVSGYSGTLYQRSNGEVYIKDSGVETTGWLQIPLIDWTNTSETLNTSADVIASRVSVKDHVGIGNNGGYHTGELVHVDAINFFPTISSSDPYYYKGMGIQTTDVNINESITDSGYRVGFDAFIDNIEFSGTLATQYGLWARAGTNGTLPTGTITKAVAVYANTLSGINSTITSLYGIYQEGEDSTKNYFEGDTGIGVDPSGTYTLEVGGDSFIDGGLTATTISADTIYSTDISASGDITGSTMSATTYSGIQHTKSLSVANPTASENITMWRTERDITVNKTNTVIVGSSLPSVTWSIQFNDERNKAGTTMNSGVAGNISVGVEDTSMTDATIPAGYWVWLTTSVASGTLLEFHITITYTDD